MFSSQVLLAGEDPADFAKLQQAIEERWQPATFEEEEAVRELTVLRWRVRRCCAVEAGLCGIPVADNMKEAAQQFAAMDRIARYQARLRKLEATGEQRLTQMQQQRLDRECESSRAAEEAEYKAAVLRNRVKTLFLAEGILEDSSEQTASVEELLGVTELPADQAELASLVQTVVTNYHLRSSGIDPETGDWLPEEVFDQDEDQAAALKSSSTTTGPDQKAA